MTHPRPLVVLSTPPWPAQLRADVAVPYRPPVIQDSTPAPAPASPEAAFVFVAITLPALISAGASFLNHAIGRHR